LTYRFHDSFLSTHSITPRRLSLYAPQPKTHTYQSPVVKERKQPLVGLPDRRPQAAKTAHYIRPAGNVNTSG
ncbi:MAG: hypothetical protein LBI87_11965, partial [Candidatus Accumulibacter sp.]|nr:hypothetical protein [Accumulibacter sp.]